MNKKILKTAQNKFKKLSKKYNGFLNVIVDDWRGYRFVFDTKDVRTCTNDCKNCPLYDLLKNEKEKNNFSAGLYKSTEQDKKICGPQNFLNCKTIEQYKNCFVQFLFQKTWTKKEIEEELDLVYNMEVIYAKNQNPNILQEKFKKDIIKKVLQNIDVRRKKIILDYINKV